MKTIYIAGKVTGEPIEEVKVKFGAAQRLLIDKGFNPINPLELVNDLEATWEYAMKKCIAALVEVDGVYLLPCYTKSPGAKMEIEIADKLNIPVCQNVDVLIQIVGLLK